MIERWKDIPGHEGRYQVSDQGRVRSFVTPNRQKYRGPRILKSAEHKITGHRWVSLWRDSKAKRVGVHRLVMLAFKPNANAKNLMVCHLNGKSDDNRLENLVWGDGKLNMSHAREHGTIYRGSRHHKAKIDENQAKEIKRMIFDGVPNREIAKLYPITENMISKIKNGRAWNAY